MRRQEAGCGREGERLLPAVALERNQFLERIQPEGPIGVRPFSAEALQYLAWVTSLFEFE
jgi:hypothetical protein